jgi:superfamily I DNA/RNA helicase
MLDSDPEWHYDWETALRDIQARIGPDEARKVLGIPNNIIVDEGQDLPQGFFKFMTMMGTNLTVFADENQRIGRQRSTISEIKLAMGISKSGGHEYQVRKNFRNTRQTAEIAAHFYTGLGTGIPDLPDKVGPKPAVVGLSGIKDLASAVLQLARRKGGTAKGSGPSVGVVVLDHFQDFKGTERRIRQLKRELEQQTEQADEVVKIRWYKDRDGFTEDPFVFDEPESVCIIKSSTMKGMEWDSVVVWLGDYNFKEDPEKLLEERMKLYVAASRPRNRLLIAWTSSDLPKGGPVPWVLSGLLEQEFQDKVERGWKNG